MRLEELLEAARLRFGDTARGTFEFSLGRIAGRWRFEVVNSWDKWIRRGLEYQFTADTPAGAVAAFLAYVDAHGIDVASMTESGGA